MKAGRSWSVYVGVSGGRTELKDEHFSGKTLKGYAPGFELGLKYGNERIKYELNGLYSNVKLESSQGSAFYADQTYLGINFSGLFKIVGEESKPFELWIGPGLMGILTKRNYPYLINDNESFESMLSVALAGELVYKFNGHTGLILRNQTQLPFASLVVQPAFGSEHSPSDIESGKTSSISYFKGSELKSWSSFAMVRNRFFVEKEINRRHSVSCSYAWEFYRLKTDRPVAQAVHQFFLHYTYTL